MSGWVPEVRLWAIVSTPARAVAGQYHQQERAKKKAAVSPSERSATKAKGDTRKVKESSAALLAFCSAKAGPGAAQQFLEGARLASLSPLTEMHKHMAYVRMFVNCWQHACETVASKIKPKISGASIGASTCRPGTKRLDNQERLHRVPRSPAGELLLVLPAWQLRSGGCPVRGPGRDRVLFPLGGERFPGNVHLSPFPSRFKRQEKNLRMVQL